MRALFAWLLPALLTGGAFSGDLRPPVTFSQLRESPAAFEGKTIRLHGMVLRCDVSQCRICPDWNGEQYTPGQPSRCIDIAAWQDRQGAAVLDKLYALTEITVEAVFRNPQPASKTDPDFDFHPVCTRYCSDFGQLFDVRVERLSTRISVTALPESQRGALLTKPTDAEDAQIRKVAEKLQDGVYWMIGAGAKTFAAPGEPYRRFICRIKETVREEEAPLALVWPSREADTGGWFRSLATPYSCYLVFRTREGALDIYSQPEDER